MVSPEDQDGEPAQRTYDLRLLRRLLVYLRPYTRGMIVSLLLITAMAGLDLVGPYLIKVAIDRHLAHGDAHGLLRLSVLFLGALLAALAVRFAQTYLLQMIGQRIVFDLRRQIFAHLQRLSVAYFDRNPTGRLMTRVTSDVDAINDLITSGIVTVVGDLLTLLGIMTVMVMMDLRLALVTFAVIPPFFLITNWFRRGARRSFRDVRLWMARINAFLQENLSGMTIISLFAAERQKVRTFAEINRGHADANMRTIFYYAVFYPTIELLGTLATAAILMAGGMRVLAGTVTLGVLVAFIQYSERFWRPISDLSEKFNILQAALVSSERIFELLDETPQIVAPRSPRSFAAAEGRIAFEDAWFAYSDENWVLKGIDFMVEPGRSIALVGATGAGKSSIIHLLMRFYDPQRGRVTLDGVDIRDGDPRELRARMALVLQDVHLFSGTIASNIRLGSDISDERVRAAARAVHIHDFIASLPQGYASEVKERGATLSGGQKQLLSFARALAHDPRVLILDEATSSVDTATEELIQDALRVLKRSRTAVIIAHRLSTVQDVDEILVMHKGRIRERGTHRSLLAARGIYHKLYELQYKDQEREGHHGQ
ncbi:MAG: ABC transporter ATP-binding protein/permease [Vicinamibacteria bacterium]|nr:ABC transporter ATP-binding protein/permease [Vicinamibacteria bacterium]